MLPKDRTPEAGVHAVCPRRQQLAARVRAFVDFVALSLMRQAATGRG